MAEVSNDIQTSVITVNSIEQKLTKAGNKMIKIRDEKNLVYNVFSTKTDGEISKAWATKPEIGDVVEVGFVESTGEDASGKPFRSRIVRFFNPAEGEPVIVEQKPQANAPRPKPARPDKF